MVQQNLPSDIKSVDICRKAGWQIGSKIFFFGCVIQRPVKRTSSRNLKKTFVAIVAIQNILGNSTFLRFNKFSSVKPFSFVQFITLATPMSEEQFAGGGCRLSRMTLTSRSMLRTLLSLRMMPLPLLANGVTIFSMFELIGPSKTYFS